MISLAPIARRLRAASVAVALCGVGLAHAGSPPGGVIDYAPVAATAVPTLAEWSLALLALLVAAVAYRVLRGRVGGRLMSNLLMAGAAAVAAFSGHGLMRHAEAIAANDQEMSSPTGGSITGSGWTRLTNTSGVAQRITSVQPVGAYSIKSPPPESPECLVGTVVAPGAKCNVEFWLVNRD